MKTIAGNIPSSSNSILLNRQIYQLLWAAIDMLVVIASYSVVFITRTIADTSNFVDSLPYIFASAGITSLFLFLSGTYRRIWNLSSGYEIRVLILPNVIVVVLMTIISVLQRPRPLPLSVIWLGSAFSLMMFATMRYRSRLFKGLHWRWQFLWHGSLPETKRRQIRVLIVGAGKSAQLFMRHSQDLERESAPFAVVGFVDDDPYKQNRLIDGKPVLGKIEVIPQIVQEHHIDLLVLAIHNITAPGFRRIVDICQKSEAQVKVLPDMFGAFTKPSKPAQLRDIHIEDLIGRVSVPPESGIDLGPIRQKVILVTGAAGSIGSELCRQVMACNPTLLLLLDNNESGLFDIENELHQSHPGLSLKPILCDVTDRDTLDKVFRQHRPQVVFHAAAYKHVPLLESHPREAVRNNIGSTLNLATLAQTYGAERFVLISSDKAVNSTNVMGATKFICERVVYALAETQQAKKTLMAIVRFGNVLGSRGSVVPLFEKQIAAGGPITVTDPKMTRYFMSISEAAHLVIQAACMTTGKNLYILEMGEQVHIVELAEHMIRLHGLRPYKDIEITFTGLRPGETMGESLMIDGERRQKTAHPHISVIHSPQVDTLLFLEKAETLLASCLHDEPENLKDMVCGLAHEIQEAYISSST